jgi:4-hydroxybenzoate polyprenyltransferase
MNPLKALIQSDIYITLAAVALTWETQVQLGLEPYWNAYLFFIFFAVLFEYSFHRLFSVLANRMTKEFHDEDQIRRIQKKIQFMVGFSGVGLFCSAFFVNTEVLFIFIPIALLTLLYSFLIFGNKKRVSGLRKVPFLKNFLIAIVWSTATVFLPVFQSSEKFSKFEVFVLILERFFFIFALSIPFDIRDMQADKQSGLRTVPILLNTQRATNISYLSLATFLMISVFHYPVHQEWFLVIAFGISAISTSLFIHSKSLKNRNYYYEGILDGTILFQAFLVFVLYFITRN